MPPFPGERGHTSEGGIHQDGQDHGSRAPDAIAQYSKENPADRSTQQEHRQRDIVVKGLGPFCGIAAQQFLSNFLHRSDEHLAFEDIKYPAQGSDQQHEPLVGGDSVKPRPVGIDSWVERMRIHRMIAKAEIQDERRSSDSGIPVEITSTSPDLRPSTTKRAPI